jgi:hypothetical protein
MIFSLYLQFPKIGKRILGKLAVGNEDIAYLFHLDNTRVETLLYPRIRAAGPDGVILTGMEPNGVENNGRKKYRYQEWYLKYPTDAQPIQATSP